MIHPFLNGFFLRLSSTGKAMSNKCKTELIKTLNFAFTPVSENTSCHVYFFNKYSNSLILSPKCRFRILLFTLAWFLRSTGNTWAWWSHNPNSIMYCCRFHIILHVYYNYIYESACAFHYSSRRLDSIY